MSRRRAHSLPPWLAAKLADYLQNTHPHADNPTAALWPRRLAGNQARKPPLDWAAPLDLDGLQSKLIRPALEAVGLPASRPERTESDGTVTPAHERRPVARSAAHGGGAVAEHRVHFIQVSKWLGHSSYVLTLTTYADYIPEQEAENPLPDPVAAAVLTNVINLHRAADAR